jgi:nucleotide-binding universal stress UspA family protein
MYRDLIIGFDGSAAGRDAVALGRRLALGTGARPTVVYVRSNVAITGDISDVPADDSWGARVAQTLDEARSILADVPGAQFTAVDETAVARVLHEVAGEAGAALIVLGATHRSGLGRVVPGTTADAVIRGAPCAVAIAPSGYARAAATRPSGLVTAAVDGGDETERVAHVAARIAERTGATLRLATVVTTPYTDGPAFAGNLGYAALVQATRAAADRILERADRAAGTVPVEREVAEGPVGAEVARLSDGADLLVIGSRGYGRVRRIALASRTAEILAAATCPVLVIPRRLPATRDDDVVPFGAATAR